MIAARRWARRRRRGRLSTAWQRQERGGATKRAERCGAQHSEDSLRILAILRHALVPLALKVANVELVVVENLECERSSGPVDVGQVGKVEGAAVGLLAEAVAELLVLLAGSCRQAVFNNVLEAAALDRVG